MDPNSFAHALRRALEDERDALRRTWRRSNEVQRGMPPSNQPYTHLLEGHVYPRIARELRLDVLCSATTGQLKTASGRKAFDAAFLPLGASVSTDRSELVAVLEHENEPFEESDPDLQKLLQEPFAVSPLLVYWTYSRRGQEERDRAGLAAVLARASRPPHSFLFVQGTSGAWSPRWEFWWLQARAKSWCASPGGPLELGG